MCLGVLNQKILEITQTTRDVAAPSGKREDLSIIFLVFLEEACLQIQSHSKSTDFSSSIFSTLVDIAGN